MDLQGPRIRLRPFEAEDVDAVAEAMQHPDLAGVGILDDDVDIPRSKAALRARIEPWPTPEGGETWIVEADGGIAGWARLGWDWDALSPWAGLAIVPELRRQGLGREAAELLLTHLFEDTVAHTVHAWIADWNTAGLGFAEALGCSTAGRVRRMGVRKGRYFDAIAFELLRRDWEERRGARR
jgi:RimJ/RimL family protein N-acetyltransferase